MIKNLIAGGFRYCGILIRRYQLTILTGFTLLFFVVFSSIILVELLVSSMQKARAIRSEFVDRDLRELVGRFDADERTTLQLNVDRLLTDIRPVTPLLLPRQYYVALPPSNVRSTPRQPPRNCFVSLVPVLETISITKAPPVKVCPYFAESKALGKYLFFSASLNDDSIVPLKPGDTNINADALKITVAKGSKVVSWWLTFQPTLMGNKTRYEVTAIRESVKGLRERDKRVEGWAYVQRQVDGTQVVQIIARIDFKEFLAEEELVDQDAGWPPEGWKDVSLFFSRKEATENLPGTITTTFKNEGISQLSIVRLSEPLYSSHANLYIQSPSFSDRNKTRAIKPINEDSDKNFRIGRISFIDGDVLVASDELVRSRILPDTNLTFVATHPGNVIEKGIWQAILYSALLFLTGVICLTYLFRHLLIPIFTLTRQSRRLVALSGNGDAKLPYANQVNEIGTLARGINELLDETRLSATREVAERNARQEADARRRLEDVQTREANIHVIGHEIRAPLQALLTIHRSGSDSRKYLDRILGALPHLQGSMGVQGAFGNRVLILEKVDMALFASEIANSAHLISIENVMYFGPAEGVFCEIDNDATQDAVTNILSNADRFRIPNSMIEITLEHSKTGVILSIANQGPLIMDSEIDHIFECGFSTTPDEPDAGSGIGLFAAKSYINKMSGTITATNLKDGVRFDIHLPILEI